MWADYNWNFFRNRFFNTKEKILFLKQDFFLPVNGVQLADILSDTLSQLLLTVKIQFF